MTLPGTKPRLRIGALSLDCAEPAELAAFYAALLDGEVLWTRPNAAAARCGSVVLVAQRVGGYSPPAWPGTSILHLDLNGTAAVDDLVAFAISIGARLVDPQPDPRWSVLVDPAGHPFCITPFSPEDV